MHYAVGKFPLSFYIILIIMKRTTTINKLNFKEKNKIK